MKLVETECDVCYGFGRNSEPSAIACTTCEGSGKRKVPMWTKVSSKKILETNWFNVREDQVINPKGKISPYFVIEKTESVFILASDSSDEEGLCLIKQCRYPTGTISWELPAGAIDPGETPLQAAQRELKEETGILANKWDYICQFPVGAGLTTNVGHIFTAEDLELTQDHRQEDEGIFDMRFFNGSQIIKMMSTGDFIDAPSIAALTLSMAHNSN